MSASARGSLLPHFLAAFYALLIAYASLTPFSGWLAPLPDTLFFLWGPWSRYTVFDTLINALAYFPLGFFLALCWPRQLHAVSATLLTSAVTGTLSLMLETAQFYLPSRYASTIDVASNAAGATIGATLALWFYHHPRWPRLIRIWRQHFFMRKKIGDFGLALLGIWLLAQINPAIPLFAATYTTELATDRAGLLLEATHTAFNVIGVGLFIAILLRHREHVGGAILSLVGLSLLIKAITASLLLKPSAWEHWLRSAVAMGLAAGCLLLLILIWLPKRAQRLICGVALLSALGATVLLPDLLFAKAPLSQFNWTYGHLLNFNGLTHTALVLWPIAAVLYLIVLAGKDSQQRPV